MGEYLRMESRFLVNLNERHMLKHREALAEAGEKHLYAGSMKNYSLHAIKSAKTHL